MLYEFLKDSKTGKEAGMNEPLSCNKTAISWLLIIPVCTVCLQLFHNKIHSAPAVITYLNTLNWTDFYAGAVHDALSIFKM